MNTKKFKKKIIYLFIFLIFTTVTHFFNDLYNIFYRGYEERMIRTYGYCGGISYGFIKKIIGLVHFADRSFICWKLKIQK